MGGLVGDWAGHARANGVVGAVKLRVTVDDPKIVHDYLRVEWLAEVGAGNVNAETSRDELNACWLATALACSCVINARSCGDISICRRAMTMSATDKNLSRR